MLTDEKIGQRYISVYPLYNALPEKGDLRLLKRTSCNVILATLNVIYTVNKFLLTLSCMCCK